VTKATSRKKKLITGGDPEAKFTLPTANDFGDADFIVAPDLKVIGEALISGVNGRISELDEAKIVYLWKRKGSESPRRILGKCQRPTGLLEYFSGADFVVWLAANNCQGMTKWQIEAIVFHELMHAGWVDGGPVMVPHDCECFAADIQRYGFWKGDLEAIGKASQEAMQLPFDMPAPKDETTVQIGIENSKGEMEYSDPIPTSRLKEVADAARKNEARQ
jgi:hypothetical protein